MNEHLKPNGKVVQPGLILNEFNSATNKRLAELMDQGPSWDVIRESFFPDMLIRDPFFIIGDEWD